MWEVWHLIQPQPIKATHNQKEYSIFLQYTAVVLYGVGLIS